MWVKPRDSTVCGCRDRAVFRQLVAHRLALRLSGILIWNIFTGWESDTDDTNVVPVMNTVRALVAFSLIPIALLAHMLVARYLGWYEKVPIVELVVMAASVIVLARMWIRSRPVKKGLVVLNVTAWILVGFFVWWTQIYSSYAKMDPAVAVGGDAKDRIAIEGLVDQDGSAVDVGAMLAESDATLFVFYRGHW